MKAELTMMVDDVKSRLETFKPLILIFLFISGVSAIATIEGGQINLIDLMSS